MSEGNDLLVIVPTRGRRANCERFLESFRETATCADLVFITDQDDHDAGIYEDMNWDPGACGILEPREYLAGKLNKTAEAFADTYRVLAWFGDDNVFITPSWDRLMLDALEDLGGSGWVYADDKRRADVPEHWMCSSDVVKALGWFANPQLGHFYIDNSIAELGKRAGIIRWCPEAVIEHKHYSVDSQAVRDELYQSTEEKFGASDYAAFQQWRADTLPYEASMLRRQFNRELRWVLERAG